MIERLLSAVVGLSLRRPRWLLAAALLPAGLSLTALSVPVDLSFGGLMDRDHPEVARYFRASERYGLGGWLLLLLEGPEAEMDRGVDAARRALAGLDVVRSVVAAPPRDWILERAPWLVDPPAFDAWLRLASDPGDREAAAELQVALERLASHYTPPRTPGARLLRVVMADDPFELALDADAFPRIRRTVRQAVAPLGLRSDFAGMGAVVAQEREATLRRMRILGAVSLGLVLLLLRRLERRVLVLMLVGVAMLLAVGTTLAIVGFVAGQITIMESVFGIMVFGLGVDFAIHLLLRLREERGGGASLPDALERTVVGTGRGIVAGAVTSGGAFLILTASPDPVFDHLGLSGGIGLLLCLVFVVALLPAGWVLLEERGPAPPPAFAVPGIGALARAATRRPAWAAAAAAGILCWGGVAFTHLRYETNLEHVFSREIRAVDTARRIQALFGLDPAPWLVPADDLAEARRVTRAFEAEPIFARIESPAFLFPEDAAARAARLEQAAPLLQRNLRALKAAGAGAPALEPLRALRRAAALGPPSLDTLPPELAARFRGRDGTLLVYAFAREPELDAATAAVERRAAQAVHPEATATGALLEALIGTERPWLPGVTAGVLAFVAVVLLLDFPQPRFALLALVPMATASAATVGILQLAGFAFNTVTLVGVPLLLGLGVDAGIHMVHRLREQPGRSLSSVAESVGPGITMTTLTTCASVFTLLFSRHPGIESLAILLLLGLPLCLLASVTVLPALAVLLRIREPG
jgi:uncharacterized membrane protein YdfJ with MMPL/SSD domain